MGNAVAVRLYFILTIISFLTFGWVLWVLGHEYPFGSLYPFTPIAIHLVCQGILTIWCIRDLAQRTFASSATTINWLGAVVLLGVVGTTAYALSVKRARWIPQ